MVQSDAQDSTFNSARQLKQDEEDRVASRSSTRTHSAHRGRERPRFSDDDFDISQVAGLASMQVSWALAVSTPLAVFGATLLAHALIHQDQSLFWIGVLCIVCIFFVQIRARQLVINKMIEAAREQGFSQQIGKRRASAFLKSWLR